MEGLRLIDMAIDLLYWVDNRPTDRKRKGANAMDTQRQACFVIQSSAKPLNSAGDCSLHIPQTAPSYHTQHPSLVAKFLHGGLYDRSP